MPAHFQNRLEFLRARTDQNTISGDILANNITEFHYDPAGGESFISCFKCLMDNFHNDLFHKHEKWKICLLILKLGTNEPDH